MEEKIKKTDKAICFKAVTGHVYLSLNTYNPCKEYHHIPDRTLCKWFLCCHWFLCFKRFQCCKYPRRQLTVYDGCKRRIIPESCHECDYHSSRITWVSESDCLKVVSKSSDDQICLEYKMSGKDEGKALEESKVFAACIDTRRGKILYFDLKAYRTKRENEHLSSSFPSRRTYCSRWYCSSKVCLLEAANASRKI